MQRAIETFPLGPTHRTKLQKAGFRTAQEVVSLSPVELAKELVVDKAEALEILKIVRGENCLAPPPAPPSALTLLSRDASLTPIPTFSTQIDNLLSPPISTLQQEHTSTQRTGLLSKGVPRGCVTEFCGAPGVGKTQLGLQLAVNVQFPKEAGGVGGESVFIDTEGSFVVERLAEIVQASLDYIRRYAKFQAGSEAARAIENMSLEGVLGGVNYFRVHSYVEQLALGYHLERFCCENPKVKLVIMDSVAFHFRGGHKDMALRTRLLQSMANALSSLAKNHGVAVVLMNQMTTKVSSTAQSQLIPALGESWGHACTHRVLLYWNDGQRRARVYKSPVLREATVTYDVTAEGVRDQQAQPGVKRGHADVLP